LLDCPGIKSHWEQGLPATIQTSRAAHQVSYIMGTGPFLGIEWLLRGVNHPPPAICEVKERVELNFYSACMASWQVIG